MAKISKTEKFIDRAFEILLFSMVCLALVGGFLHIKEEFKSESIVVCPAKLGNSYVLRFPTDEWDCGITKTYKLKVYSK